MEIGQGRREVGYAGRIRPSMARAAGVAACMTSPTRLSRAGALTGAVPLDAGVEAGVASLSSLPANAADARARMSGRLASLARMGRSNRAGAGHAS